MGVWDMGNKLYTYCEAYLYRIMLVMMSGEFLQTWDAFCLGYKCTDKI